MCLFEILIQVNVKADCWCFVVIFCIIIKIISLTTSLYLQATIPEAEKTRIIDKNHIWIIDNKHFFLT